MKTLKFSTAFCLLGLLTSQAYAGDDMTILLTNAKLESESLGSGFKLQYHHYFGDNMGIELAHGKYGEYERYDWYSDSDSSQTAKASNIGFIVKTANSDSVNVFGKVGASHWSLGSGYSDTNGYIGFGVNIQTGSSAMFVIEFEKINADSREVSSINLGIGGSF